MSLRDLDELVLSCRTEEARSYIAEAVACYKAGAFRACIVSTWIAVVFDLIEKMRELALSGDAEAQRIVAELTARQPLIERGNYVAIRQSLEFERDIVTIANDKFAFFDGLQVLDLNRLRDDRNRCAHPTYQGTGQPYSPSSELARAHLVHAVQHSLSKPPVQGKAATEHIVRLVESAFFPTDIEQAKVQLRSGGLERPKDSLVTAVTDHLIYGLLEGTPHLKGRRQTAIALRAVHDLFPGLSEARIRRGLNSVGRRAPDGELGLLLWLQKYLPQAWDYLEQDNRQRISELVRQSSDQVAVTLLTIALGMIDLADVAQVRLTALGHQELGEILKANPRSQAIARAVDIYCSSRSWDEANSRYQHAIEPILDKLDEAQLRRILAAPTAEGADLNGAHSFSNFARYIYENQKLPRPEIIGSLEQQGMQWLVERLQPRAPADLPF